MFRLSTTAEGMVVLVATGDLTSAEATSAYRHFLDVAACAPKVLWDLTAATLDPISSTEIRELAATLGRLAKGRRGPGRSAVLCRPGVDFGLARMFAALFCEEGSAADLEVFHDLYEAMVWLATGQTWPYDERRSPPEQQPPEPRTPSTSAS